MTDVSASGVLPRPQPQPKETSCADSCVKIGVTKNCCAILGVGGILAAIGFTLLFYSPLNLATTTGLAKCIVGSVLAATGSLLIIYKVFVNCSACCKENIEEGEQRKKMQDDYAALVEAIKQHRIEKVKSWLKKGRDIDFIDEKGWAPLHYAAKFGNPEIIKVLVEKGNASINLRSKKDESGTGNGEKFPGQTPLHCALFRPPFSKSQIEEYIQQHPVPDDTDEQKRWEIVDALLQLGASTDILDEKETSPEFVAQFYNYQKIVRLLQNSRGKFRVTRQIMDS